MTLTLKSQKLPFEGVNSFSSPLAVNLPALAVIDLLYNSSQSAILEGEHWLLEINWGVCYILMKLADILTFW